LRRLKTTSLIIYLLLLVCYGFSPPEVKKVCIRNTCVKVEVARTDSQKEKGLMDRQRLPQDEGMLFVFDEQKIRAFWMKNMRFPLDIIWMKADKKIVSISEDVEPCKETCPALISNAPVQFVLEVNSGFAQKNKIKVGDQLEF
jgi:uncharacterized membrane protein (UPF0127 family)